MTHLTPDEFVDATEGVLPPERRRHLDACERCRREALALTAVLREAADLPVPEPSPLYWDQLSARVRAAVSREPEPAGGRADWFRWPVLLPLGAWAALVIAMVGPMPRTVPADEAVVMTSIGEPGEPGEPGETIETGVSGDRWEVMADLVGPLDWETANLAGLSVRPGDAELALLSLSEEEQRELSRLLASELSRTKS